MTTWQAFLFGIIQGITEFLPISSSGHLALGQHFFQLQNLQNAVLFNLVCHLGTLLAIISVFFSSILEKLKNSHDYLGQLLIGTLPLFPLVLILKPLKDLFVHPQLLGPCFLVSSALLFISLYWKFPRPLQSDNKRWQDSFTIGLFQAVAILPGISRSGATISAAYLLGWQKTDAVLFSFLLAVPAILGGIFLEGWQVWQTPTILSLIDPSTYLVGFFTSFIVGYFSLKIFIRLVVQDKWIYFAWYCLLLGIVTILYYH